MPLDDRLRAGFTQAAGAVSPDVEDRLQRTQTSFRRRRGARRATAATTLAVLVGVVVVMSPQVIDGLSSGSQAPPGTTVPSPSPSGLELTGLWVTPVVTPQLVTGGLQDAGLLASADTVITDLGFPTAWTLEFTDATFSVTSSTGVQVDAGDYTLDGNTLSMTPTCTKDDQPVACTVTYALTLDGDTLTFDLVSDDSPDYLEAPDEAFQQALYMTVPFTRS